MNLASQTPVSSPASRQENASADSGWRQSLAGAIRYIFGHRHDASLKEALEEVIEEHEEQAEERLAPEEKLMLRNILAFSEIKVSEIMVPRTDIAAVPHDITLATLSKHITEFRHTRIPVYEETLDRVLGFVHVKDLLPMLGGTQAYQLKGVTRELLFVPPSMRIIDLLVKMRKSGYHMAIVVDEHGGTDGLVTMEDLFEEIVGDIQDEHDSDEESNDKITRLSEKVYEVSARIRIDKLEKELGLGLVTEEKEDEFDTLGGLIFFQLGRVPVKGEIIPHVSGMRFEIVAADPRKIHRVRILTAK